jgi:hypothetical protein
MAQMAKAEAQRSTSTSKTIRRMYHISPEGFKLDFLDIRDLPFIS